MVDYYALPAHLENGWPERGNSAHHPTPYKAQLIQNAMQADIANFMGGDFDHSRFVPYIMMYKFEGLLFSDPHQFAAGIYRSELAPEFAQILSDFESPEHINDSPQTAPSKRIINLIPHYQKPFLGVMAASHIGLATIRGACPLFNQWIEKLESVC